MPSKYVEDMLKKLAKEVGIAVEQRDVRLTDVGAPSTVCKEAAKRIPGPKEKRVAYYMGCLTEFLRGRGPQEILREEADPEDVCRMIGSKLLPADEVAKFERHCRTGLRRGRTIKEILDEYEF